MSQIPSQMDIVDRLLEKPNDGDLCAKHYRETKSQPPEGKTETVKCECGHAKVDHDDRGQCWPPKLPGEEFNRACPCNKFSPAQSPAQQGAEVHTMESANAMWARRDEIQAIIDNARKYVRSSRFEPDSTIQKSLMEAVTEYDRVVARYSPFPQHPQPIANEIKPPSPLHPPSTSKDPLQSEMMPVVDRLANEVEPAPCGCDCHHTRCRAARLLRAMGKCIDKQDAMCNADGHDAYTKANTARWEARAELSTLIKSMNTEKQA